MKIVKCLDPLNEVHKTAMAVALQLGNSVSVVQNGSLPEYFIVNWDGNKLARFERS